MGDGSTGSLTTVYARPLMRTARLSWLRVRPLCVGPSAYRSHRRLAGCWSAPRVRSGFRKLARRRHLIEQKEARAFAIRESFGKTVAVQRITDDCGLR